MTYPANPLGARWICIEIETANHLIKHWLRPQRRPPPARLSETRPIHRNDTAVGRYVHRPAAQTSQSPITIELCRSVMVRVDRSSQSLESNVR